MYDLRKS